MAAAQRLSDDPDEGYGGENIADVAQWVSEALRAHGLQAHWSRGETRNMESRVIVKCNAPDGVVLVETVLETLGLRDRFHVSYKIKKSAVNLINAVVVQLSLCDD
jgi:hypothetical protein